MERYLIDSNVVSDYFSASLQERGLQFMDSVIDDVPNLSVISQIELLCWKTQPHKEKVIREFIADSIIIDLTPEVISYCVDIRRHRRVKIPDAIIAATALAFGYTLISSNDRDFSHIEGLKYVNPHKI